MGRTVLDRPVFFPPTNTREEEIDRLLRRLRELFDEPAGPVGRVKLHEAPLARRVRRMQQEQEARARFVASQVAAEPAWPMLLELFACALAGKPASVKRLTYASGVPATTALRWINLLVDEGYATRKRSGADARLTLLTLSAKGEEQLRRYFAHLARHAVD